MMQNGKQTPSLIIPRIKPLLASPSNLRYLHTMHRTYHIPTTMHDNTEDKSRNPVEKANNKKINKRYENEEDELENSCYSINQARDSPNMCSTACTKKLKREVSCISSIDGQCTEVNALISFLPAMC